MKKLLAYIIIIVLCATALLLACIRVEERSEPYVINVPFVVDTVYVQRTDTVCVVRATTYQAVEAQCDEDCLTTASGMHISSAHEAHELRIIAVSRDLLPMFPYGTKVEVTGTGIYDGVYSVEDTMNKRYTNSIDILIDLEMPIGSWDSVCLRKK